MNRLLLISALFAALSMAACDNTPTVVNVPPAAPGPAGPPGQTGATGATGNEGAQGNTGNTGKTGDGTTVIVTPPAEPAQ